MFAQHLDQSREGGDRPIIPNSETAVVLESLECLIRGLIWWSDWKVGETHFGSQYWTQKHQNCPKSISRKPLVVESWLTPQNDRKTWFTIGVLRHVYFSDNRKSPKNTIFCFLGPFNDKVAWFSISGELPIFKNGWPLKMSVVDMYTAQSTRSAQQMSFFLALYLEILKVSISREPYVILNWLTFQKDRKTDLSISV